MEKIHVCKCPHLRLTEQKGRIPAPKRRIFSHAPALKDMYYYELVVPPTQFLLLLTTTRPYAAIQKCEGVPLPTVTAVIGAGTGISSPSSSGHSRSIYKPPSGAALLTRVLTNHHCHGHDDGRTSEGSLSYPAANHCRENACHVGDSPGCSDWGYQTMGARSCCFREPLRSLHSCRCFSVVSLMLPKCFLDSLPNQQHPCRCFPASLPKSVSLLVSSLGG
uniref:Uncharacterized protein n=1 Tax=Zea mays TaxID=4577 RepID=C4J2A2_MAIZE|nr:unknown [Zea mays]